MLFSSVWDKSTRNQRLRQAILELLELLLENIAFDRYLYRERKKYTLTRDRAGAHTTTAKRDKKTPNTKYIGAFGGYQHVKNGGTKNSNRKIEMWLLMGGECIF